MRNTFVAIAAIPMLIFSASSGCADDGGDPQPSITIKPPKYSERPKNKDKRYSNKPKPRISPPPCTPGDKRWICPR